MSNIAPNTSYRYLDGTDSSQFVDGNFEIDGNLQVNGDATVADNFYANNASFGSLSVSGNLDMGNYNILNVNTITGTTANYQNLLTVSGTIGSLLATTGTIGALSATTGTIGSLLATTGTISNLLTTIGTVGSLLVSTGTIANLTTTTLNISNLSLNTITATTGNIDQLNGRIIAVSGNIAINATSASYPLSISNPNGNIQIGTGNATQANLITDRNSFTFNKSVDMLTQNITNATLISATTVGATNITGSRLGVGSSGIYTTDTLTAQAASSAMIRVGAFGLGITDVGITNSLLINNTSSESTINQNANNPICLITNNSVKFQNAARSHEVIVSTSTTDNIINSSRRLYVNTNGQPIQISNYAYPNTRAQLDMRRDTRDGGTFSSYNICGSNFDGYVYSHGQMITYVNTIAPWTFSKVSTGMYELIFNMASAYDSTPTTSLISPDVWNLQTTAHGSGYDEAHIYGITNPSASNVSIKIQTARSAATTDLPFWIQIKFYGAYYGGYNN
jgi:hypothetical protein